MCLSGWMKSFYPQKSWQFSTKTFSYGAETMMGKLKANALGIYIM